MFIEWYFVVGFLLLMILANFVGLKFMRHHIAHAFTVAMSGTLQRSFIDGFKFGAAHSAMTLKEHGFKAIFDIDGKITSLEKIEND